MIQTGRRVTALFVATVLISIILIACSTPGSAGSVSVLGPWTAEEEQYFRRVLAGFEEATGVQVVYQGTRALNEVLLSNVQNGTPPDVAILFSVGELGQYQNKGQLHELDDVIAPEQEAAYSSQWRQLQSLGTNNLYGAVVKANLKSIVWFNPRHVSTPAPKDLNELLALSQSIVAGRGGTPWCMGMGSTPTSGWPGTDWIEDILLYQFGTDIYQQWAAGTLSWTSPQVRKAWEDWGKVVDTTGPRSVLLTDFQDAGRPMFTDPPGCFLHHQPSFTMTNYQTYETAPRPGSDFDFFRFPDGPGSAGPTNETFTVSADMAVMFKDTPQARQLIKYLATDKAQRIWPSVSSGAFSINRNVELSVYTDNVSKRIAQELTTADTLCFDATDLMPATMRNAFYRAVLEYVSDPNQLNRLLEDLDVVRRGIAPEEWLNIPCGR